jgi:predicted Zn-dependent protease
MTGFIASMRKKPLGGYIMKDIAGRGLLVAAIVGTVLVVATPAVADWNAGVNAYRNKDYATAIKEFEKVTETNPDYAGAYYMLGLAQNGAGKVSSALASARKAVELDSAQASYKVFLGQVLVQADQFQEGYSTLKQVNLSSIDASMRSQYVLVFARAATKANHVDEAIRTLNTQIRADSRNPRLYIALGEAHGALGDDKQRFQAFKKAFELNSKDKQSGKRAATAATAVARRTSNAQEKIRYYRDAATLAEALVGISNTFENMLLAGESWMGAKEYAKANEWFARAKQKKPRNSLVCFYRGQSYSSLNQFDNALGELQEALAIGAADSLRNKIYTQMGYVYDKKKDYVKAKSAYGEAGNAAKQKEMDDKIEMAKQNREADAEQAEFDRKLRGLRLQIEELRKIGEDAEADELQKQLDELEKHARR